MKIGSGSIFKFNILVWFGFEKKICIFGSVQVHYNVNKFGSTSKIWIRNITNNNIKLFWLNTDTYVI